MQDDPFARAVERQQAAEQAQQAASRDRVRRQVSSGARTAFRTHATVFVAVNLLLIAIWAGTGTGYPWFIYPLLGWGIGLAAHWSATAQYMRRREGRDAGLRARGRYGPTHAPDPYSAPPSPAVPLAQAPVMPPVAVVPTSPGPGQNISEELARLAELHKTGVLDDAEFATAKARLLS